MLRKTIELVGSKLGDTLDADENNIDNVDTLDANTAKVGGESSSRISMKVDDDDKLNKNVFTFDIPDDDVESITVFNRTRLDVYNGVGFVGLLQSGPMRSIFIDSNQLSNEGNPKVLTGTTGPDGTTNISQDGNTVYIENRTGSSDEVQIHFVRAP